MARSGRYWPGKLREIQGISVNFSKLQEIAGNFHGTDGLRRVRVPGAIAVRQQERDALNTGHA